MENNKCRRMEGELVSEEETAAGLGFANVIEFRRWQTEVGHKLAETERELQLSRDEVKRFQWHLKRHGVVLEKVLEWMGEPPSEDKNTPYHKSVSKLILAIKVVTGRGVDWNNELDDWFDPINKERQ